MPDQSSQDIHNEQSNQGAQGTFHGPVTINQGEAQLAPPPPPFVAPELPPHFLPRPDDLDALKQSLLAPNVGTVALTDLLGVGPITGEELGMLRQGNIADIAPFVAAFGFVPLPFEESIRVRDV
jgi:hypothetical protein